MTKSFLTVALAATCWAAPVNAAELFSGSASPLLSVAVGFGASSHNGHSLPFAMQLDLVRRASRPQFLHIGTSTQPPANLANSPQLNLVRFAADRQTLHSLRVFGRDLLRPAPALNQNEEPEQPQGDNWIWWTAGVLATGAALVLLNNDDGDDRGSSIDGDGDGDGERDCVAFNNGVGPGGVVDTSDPGVHPERVDTSGC